MYSIKHTPKCTLLHTHTHTHTHTHIHKSSEEIFQNLSWLNSLSASLSFWLHALRQQFLYLGDVLSGARDVLRQRIGDSELVTSSVDQNGRRLEVESKPGALGEIRMK